MDVLKIVDLHVNVEDKEILKGVSLTARSGETVALLGPNGHGKSTLLQAIMGNPRYQITSGQILLNDQDVLTMSVDERSKAGLFLGMQYPSEVSGVVNADFLRASINARRAKPLSLFQFYRLLDSTYKKMGIPFEMANRSLNVGFSGGEKKRNEILQMILLEPRFALLDEIDSGLDIDAMTIVASAIREEQEKGRGFLVVSHYARLYNMINLNRTIVMVNGKIAVEGGPEIIQKIDTKGYEWIKTELGIDIEKEEPAMSAVSIGVCATKEAIRDGK
ncbi:MAG TPA: Fe-S cluster assembly ATPase SufC [Bacilli bacterium]|jgi:Fe-S cluster assembly ATP-binding protein|nr:Fe-S cluster assembly ATPase SufC [Campylobacterota bacterium]NLB39923.1 Fe-S cluster assembly ATPase SufC [Erysipelotrichaceae bacterium]HNY74597.1 Fe-S cluster assembly ATPase SufC [Bacilli bacterium]HPM07214.1 Fe-S cluster assembly ATPase SufC [Bacilli bacterium]HPY37863.1 Fe-S cluster assembly ATPase SufC [Bacilli bacterium]